MTSSAPLGAVFTAGAEQFDRWSELFWGPMGEATVASARLAAGATVLDACCGAGASALPAARAVGPSGRVHGVDLAPGLLRIGRAAAAAEGLSWLEFTEADVTTWPAPAGGYDVVQCAYGVFFLPDMDAGTAYLAGLLRPGGRLVVTTWRRDGMGRLPDLVARSVNEVNAAAPPVESEAGKVWRRISTPELAEEWLTGLGLADVEVREESVAVSMDADLAWALVLGTGMRRMLAALDEGQTAEVRHRLGAALEAEGVRTFAGDSLVVTGTRR